MQLVLWWMSFQVMTLARPVVREVPTVKVRRWAKALRNSPSTLFPSGQSGRYATRVVPGYRTPGLGCSTCRGDRGGGAQVRGDR